MKGKTTMGFGVPWEPISMQTPERKGGVSHKEPL